MLYDPNWKPKEADIQLETWQKILLRAAEILQTQGWCRGTLQNEHGFCALGAIAVATGEIKEYNGDVIQGGMFVMKTKIHLDSDYIKSTMKLLALIQRYNNIPTWNDQPTRNKRHVIAKMRRAAGVK